MPLADQDPSLIQDFLTESGELIDQLDSDLLRLENADEDPELLNSIFRALHTIKGAASFLDLRAVIRFAHTAEFALDRLRKGEAELTADAVDTLLRSNDILKAQLAEMQEGTDPTDAPEELLRALDAIGSAESPAEPTTQPTAGTNEAANTPLNAVASPLELPPEKRDVMPYMVADLLESLDGIDAALDELDANTADADRDAIGARLNELGTSAETTTEFFDLAQLKELAGLFVDAAEHLAHVETTALTELTARLRAASLLTRHAADALAEQRLLTWNIDTLCDRCILAARNTPDSSAARDHNNDTHRILSIDGVITDTKTPENIAQHHSIDPRRATLPATTASEPTAEPKPEPNAHATSDPAPTTTEPAKKPEQRSADTTIRVEVARLENLMNLVGEMTLTKNQVLAASREIGALDIDFDEDLDERLHAAASDLDRLTSELQQNVMRTRMQPLDKLFGRYPRIVRDLARKTDKAIELRIEGGDTEVDKSVLELLGDPLVHMLRNSVDHGIESPQQRAAAGKPETGTLILRAEHQGGHVRVTVKDDGQGIDRDKIAEKALSKGLATAEQLATMSDEDVFRFLFAAGFSTAEQVSDLSGRGVGMDVVNSNIKRLNGDVNIRSTLGQGTAIEIMIPLTVATMPAMVVRVGDADYALPLGTIEEITRVAESECNSVGGRPVIRLRDEVIGLIDMRAELQAEHDGSDDAFAVIIAVGQEKAGLVVDRLIGQQEVVIKTLDDDLAATGPFSGATIREDGRVNLILDVVKLLRQNENHSTPA